MRSPGSGWRSTRGSFHLAYSISLFHLDIIPRGRHSRTRFRLLRILTSYEKLLNRLLTFHTSGDNIKLPNYPPRVHVLVARPIIFVHQMLNKHRYLGHNAEVGKMVTSAYLHSCSPLVPVSWMNREMSRPIRHLATRRN